MVVEIRSRKGPPKPELDFPIVTVDLELLKPHEMTIEAELNWFMDSISRDPVIYWPMLVAKEENLILDGHHRQKGLLQLGYKTAPAIIIDYMDDDLVRLGTWYPCLQEKPSNVSQELQKRDLRVARAESGQLDLRLLESREFTAYLGNEKGRWKVSGEREVIFKAIRDLWLNEITYYDDPNLCFEAAGQDKTAIIAWSYNKNEILDHVSKGLIHLPKTTRHELKYRVPKCNIPLTEMERL